MLKERFLKVEDLEYFKTPQWSLIRDKKTLKNFMMDLGGT